MIDIFQLSNLKVNIGLPFFHDDDLILALLVYKFMLKMLHAGGFIKASYQSLVAHQNELSMLRWCIWLALQEHPLLSVDQPAFTVELLLVSGVIRLLLQHHCNLARLTIGVRPIHSKDESHCPVGLALVLLPPLEAN